ncbi:MAG TPA: hypothetical protein DEA08_35285 [Planctomycetes bacterium]|nr:hypothetical protein [Planctomycetota bacterium]
MKLVLRADPALTCAVCNTDAFGDLICCEGCGVLGHEACLSEVGACPGSECEVQRAPAFVPERARRRRLPWVQGLAVVTLLALGAVAAHVASGWPSPDEVRQLRLIEACKAFKERRARWPTDIDELSLIYVERRARQTPRGGAYQLTHSEGSLLLVWPDGEGGWAAREVR